MSDDGYFFINENVFPCNEKKEKTYDIIINVEYYANNRLYFKSALALLSV